jgi:hypothetical protein
MLAFESILDSSLPQRFKKHDPHGDRDIERAYATPHWNREYNVTPFAHEPVKATSFGAKDQG